MPKRVKMPLIKFVEDIHGRP